MEMKGQYEQAKIKLLNDKSICKENLALYKKTLEYEEKKLKRKNNIPVLDDSTYKTLYAYILKFKNVNKWFQNKPLNKLTKETLKKFFDDFQEDKILNNKKTPFQDKEGYYHKIFRSKLFEFAGKKDLVGEIMNEEFFSLNKKKEVRFIEEADVKRIIQTAIQPEHKLLLQLIWDVGENPFTWLQTEKRDYKRSINENNESEYHINLRQEILKRSRKKRTEITNFKESVELLDLILKDKKDNDKVFNFGLRQAEKVFDRAVKILGVKTIGDNPSKPQLKDLRSSMSCYLLKEGWSCDEVNARLGHIANSPEINKYVDYLALDRHKPKKKIFDNNLQKIQKELEQVQQREKVKDMRIEDIKQQLSRLIDIVNYQNQQQAIKEKKKTFVMIRKKNLSPPI